ncbi:MAG: glycosyltransferase [Vicinamibacterales bacterium]
MSGVTAIVTAFQRIDQTLATLRTLEGCVPPPAEILVHVDGNQRACAEAIRAAHPGVRVLISEGTAGPGGGRNRLIAESTQPFVASFDDDSYPIDADYFSRATEVFASFPDASVIGASEYHSDEVIGPDTRTASWVADFVGGACAYRRDAFLRSGGYVPIATAYGMEEVDLALRLHASGGRVLRTRWLRVFHDTDRARHADPAVTAASIANIALLAYLRYPIWLWGVGVGQGFNRIVWLLGHGRRRGILRGLVSIPVVLRQYASARHLVTAAALFSYLRLRRHPVAAPFGRV